VGDERVPSVAEIVAPVKAGELDCRTVAEAFLARARAADAGLNCFIGLDADAALERAAALDRRRDAGGDLGALAGVPFATKDIFASGERQPTNGSSRVRLATAARSATALERLITAGAVNLGWLNLDQFSYAATGTNPEFGSVRNPWNPERMTGGSSSGAAAAVASGAAAFAIGGDTGGSVRIPASYCGAVGLKPTFGRIPRRGSTPMCFSQDSLGIIARSVADAALVLEVLAGHDPLDASSFDVAVPAYASRLGAGEEGLRGVRVGFDRAYASAFADAQVQAATEAAVELMADHGADVVPVDLGRLAAYDLAATVITWAEVGALHSRSFPQRRSEYAPATRARLQSALLSHGADHVNALRFQGRALREFLRDVLSVADVAVCPSTAGSPAPIADVEDDDRRGVVTRSLDSLALNRPFNLLGLPAMSVPMGFDGLGLPMGMQLVSRPWDELTLLRCGASYQAMTDWHRRTPAQLPASDRSRPAA
jgi:aspartyl-tRNA(Asn)/glutamyl-tRNA(Gln) amidotransferase subunit A